jgi:aspartyl aminopeptidase
VNAAYDPGFAEVYEKRNAAFVNYGVCLSKYTGARGKSGSSDASTETVAHVRGIFERADVLWQIAELGKTDVGGGGTVAQFMANRNIDTIDAGVAVLSMHAPVEVVSKLDCYETYKGMKAVYQA